MRKADCFLALLNRRGAKLTGDVRYLRPLPLKKWSPADPANRLSLSPATISRYSREHRTGRAQTHTSPSRPRRNQPPPGKETPNVQVSTGDSKDLTEYEASPTQNIMRDPMKSVHTLCCFDSGDELKFAQMLDEANDVALWL